MHAPVTNSWPKCAYSISSNPRLYLGSGVKVGVSVSVGVTVGIFVGVGVLVDVGDAVGVEVSVEVGVVVDVGVWVGVLVCVGSGGHFEFDSGSSHPPVVPAIKIDPPITIAPRIQ